MFKYVFWFLLFFNCGFLTGGGNCPPCPPPPPPPLATAMNSDVRTWIEEHKNFNWCFHKCLFLGYSYLCVICPWVFGFSKVEWRESVMAPICWQKVMDSETKGDPDGPSHRPPSCSHWAACEVVRISSADFRLFGHALRLVRHAVRAMGWKAGNARRNFFFLPLRVTKKRCSSSFLQFNQSFFSTLSGIHCTRPDPPGTTSTPVLFMWESSPLPTGWKSNSSRRGYRPPSRVFECQRLFHFQYQERWLTRPKKTDKSTLNFSNICPGGAQWTELRTRSKWMGRILINKLTQLDFFLKRNATYITKLT